MTPSRDWNDRFPMERLLWTLDVVHREGHHLLYSWNSLFAQDRQTDEDWVKTLDDHPEEAIYLEAFVSRFGRMQDTIAHKLLPRWLEALAESPGSQIEMLNRAERLGVIESTENWLMARKLRNRLIHEYMRDPGDFAAALDEARKAALILTETYNRLRDDLPRRLSVSEDDLPPSLP